MKTEVIMAGGGTAGHVLPALSIAQALVERGHEPGSIHFVGSRRGQEAELVPHAKFTISLLPGRGVPRQLSLRSLAATAGLAVALVESTAILLRRRPAVVVSVGGYASLPTTLAAVALRIPLVLCNLDAVPNGANSLVARFATASAVAFAETRLPRATVTGSPVRLEITQVDRSPEGRRRARVLLGLPEGRHTVVVISGSLGSARINSAVAALALRWSDRSDVSIRHVVGRRDWSPMLSSTSQGQVSDERGSSRVGIDGLYYRPVAYEEQMPSLLGAADVLVGRAGASTVAELTAVGLASVLVPLPGAPHDHQTANARVLADAGAAILVPDPECTGLRLGQELDTLLADPRRLEVMDKAAASLGRPDAADAVARVVEAALDRAA
ncbi:MAG: UDP-N-acetylglucosamine--N-acetylmuramyl-(pentapeptide) pyrophosphoryl-undecaprenol N-acetylglucosamine transferase [Acidimicrobiales bacterium]